MNIVWMEHDLPLGTMVLAACDCGLIGAWFVGQAHFAGPQAEWRADPVAPLLQQAARQLDEWFAGARRRFDLPLAPQGTPFRQAVWNEIARIDYGQTRAYGSLAAALGRPHAARAVGAATGRNPWSIIVPCHRLVGRDGGLTGYAGGLERKRELLGFEAGRVRFA